MRHRAFALLLSVVACGQTVVPTATRPDGKLVAELAHDGMMWMPLAAGGWAPQKYRVRARIVVDPATGEGQIEAAPGWLDGCPGPILERVPDVLRRVTVGPQWSAGCKWGKATTVTVTAKEDCSLWIWSQAGQIETGGCQTDPASAWRRPPLGARYLGAARFVNGAISGIYPVDRPVEVFPIWSVMWWGE